MKDVSEGSESVQLVARWRDGDELAAKEIYDRYVSRLIALAGSRISSGLARRVEAEDVVQSVYKSFFNRLADDRLSVKDSGQLWGLLAAITVNKVRERVRFHTAGKRDVQVESSTNTTASMSCYGLEPSELARDPTAEEATILVEQYALAAKKMTPLGRQVFELFMASHSNGEIAKAVRRSERTIRRELEQIRSILTDALVEANPDSHE